MMENNKKKISVLIISVCLVLVLIVGISYAYFSRSGASNARTVQAGTLRIQYANDNTNTVTLDNIAPILDADIQTKANKIGFTVTNTGSSLAYVSISLTDMTIPDELKRSDFKWALYSGNTKVSDGNFSGATNPMNLIKNEQIASQASKSYQLFIWISETGQEQNSMMNKSFSAKITINGSQHEVASPKLLTQKIIEDNSPVVTTTPNFGATATTDEGLIKGTDADGDTYYFRGNVQDNYIKINGLKWTSDYSLVALATEDKVDWNYGTSLQEACSTDPSGGNDGFYNWLGYESVEDCVENVTPEYNISHKAGDDMLFKIVRINGSGTTRIILDGSIGESVFNTDDDSEKYVGYTYDNGKTCTNASPCTSSTGTSSTIKSYIENWYNNTLTSYDSLFATEKFCNDTSVSSTSGRIIYYGAYGRLNTNNSHTPEPQFTCPDTSKTYGGVYNLKVGLLSADEAVFAGGKPYESNTNYYLSALSKWWWVASPVSFGGGSISEFNIYDDGSFKYGSVFSSGGAVAPVFNLKSDLLYSSGNGTKSDPYVVSVS